MEKPWYSSGLQFSCTQCGDCCRSHGDYRFVYLSEKDISQLADHFNLTNREFLFKYTEKEDIARVLKWPNDACVFLGENGCTVYPARPRQCRTWPFWPETLERSIWEGEVVPFCPGAGKGRLYTLEEIRRLSAGEGETRG